MYSIVAILALLQPPAVSDSPSMESITAAWKKMATLPGNYSVKYRCYQLRMNEECTSNVTALAQELSKQGNDISFQTVTDKLSNSGILELADSKSVKPSKVTVLANGDSCCNRMYLSSDKEDIVACFSQHKACMVYRNDFNKAYQVDLRRSPSSLTSINDLLFVPSNVGNMVKINQEQSDRSKIHLDIDSKDEAGFGFYVLDPTSKLVKYFEATDKKRNSKHIVAQCGMRTSGNYSIPACFLDYVVHNGTVGKMNIYVVDSFAVDSVLEKDFVIGYNKNWLIMDIRSGARYKYDFEFDDVCNHLTAKPKP